MEEEVLTTLNLARGEDKATVEALIEALRTLAGAAENVIVRIGGRYSLGSAQLIREDGECFISLNIG